MISLRKPVLLEELPLLLNGKKTATSPNPPASNYAYDHRSREALFQKEFINRDESGDSSGLFRKAAVVTERQKGVAALSSFLAYRSSIQSCCRKTVPIERH